MNPPEVAVCVWDFVPGSFSYRGQWHNLDGQPLRLLEAFVRAKRYTLTHAEVNSAAANNEGFRPYAYVCELNKDLCRLWSLDQRPIRPIPGIRAYRLTPP
jgi:hypothetical protein